MHVCTYARMYVCMSVCALADVSTTVYGETESESWAAERREVTGRVLRGCVGERIPRRKV